MKFIKSYINECKIICENIDIESLNRLLKHLVKLKKRGGRLFIIVVGGSAGNASHAVNDFRKICNIEAYAPTDNVSEITARTNDEGWDTVFEEWLKISKLNKKDLILFLSVGGGSIKKKISVNLIKAALFAKKKKCNVIGIIGKKDGYIKKIADNCCVVPFVRKETVTAHTETFQVLIWHMLVNHPLLKENKNVWEIKSI